MPTKLPLRGLMLDAARLVELPRYYARFLDFCQEWNINAVIVRLTDDQGCAIRFRSHPELITHAHALDGGQVQSLVRHAAARKVLLIPEIESFGHSRCITRCAAHSDLWDRPEGDNPYGALIPLHPKTLSLLSDLYAEAAALFPGPYLHAGCDETNWGGSAFSRALLQTRTRARVWGEYLNALNEMARGLGREMIIWDDMVLQHEPEILDHLDRRIILHDWRYDDTDPAGVAARLDLARSKGFRVIGGPAVSWCRWGPRVGRSQLDNIAAYAEVYRAADSRSALGVIVTHWCPARFIQNSQWDSLAFAAVALGEGPEAARTEACPRFVERHYGASWNPVWARVFDAMYGWAPTRHGDTPVRLLVPWDSDEAFAHAIRASPLPKLPYESLAADLDRLERAVRRHPEDFAAFRLTVAYLAHLYARHERVRGLEGAGLETAVADVARRDAIMADALLADWRSGRPGDPLEDTPGASSLPLRSPERLHASFLLAAQYSRRRSGAGSA